MNRRANVGRLSVISLAAGLTLGCAPVADPEPQAATEPVASPSAKVAATPSTTKPIAVPGTLQTRIETAVEHVRQRDLLTTNAFWTIFHGILGFGPGMTLLDPNSNTRVNALDYVFGGQFPLGEIRGLRFIPTEAGLDVQTGPTFVGQGHQDQFIAEVAQWGEKADRKVVVYGKEYTFMDFVRESQARARLGQNQELSWAIVVIGQYVGTEARWTNRHGEKLYLPDLVRAELDAPTDTAACGGTHRLFGLNWVLHLHLRNGGKLEGVWKDVADKMTHYKNLAKQYQNPDGSLSSNYFRGPGSSTDMQERIGTTGHTLEWLAESLSDEELREQWVEDAANALALMFLEIQSAPMESGALYHAAHGLVIYNHRVFKSPAAHAANAEESNPQLTLKPRP